jgi:hypothetical protein
LPFFEKHIGAGRRLRSGGAAKGETGSCKSGNALAALPLGAKAGIESSRKQRGTGMKPAGTIGIGDSLVLERVCVSHRSTLRRYEICFGDSRQHWGEIL